jgi:hypothetical protein
VTGKLNFRNAERRLVVQRDVLPQTIHDDSKTFVMLSLGGAVYQHVIDQGGGAVGISDDL